MTGTISHRRWRSPLRLLGLAAGLLLTTAAGAQTPLPTWPASEAPAELRPAIARADLVIVGMHRYPVDRAVGFKEGEIRGWFWVEMPKRTQ